MTFASLAECWQHRELLYFFAWRDIKVRYRQAVLGTAWAVLQPLLNMIMFAVIFGRLAHMPSNGIPCPIFVYCALVPWTYFSGVMSLASNCLASNSSLITKVYFPRLLLTVGTALAGLLDFAIASALLVGLMFYYRMHVVTALIAIRFAARSGPLAKVRRSCTTLIALPGSQRMNLRAAVTRESATFNAC